MMYLVTDSRSGDRKKAGVMPGLRIHEAGVTGPSLFGRSVGGFFDVVVAGISAYSNKFFDLRATVNRY
jgi:hypothetical protein